MAKLLCLKHSQVDLLSKIEGISKRKIDVDSTYNVKNEIDNELKKAKKDINDAVRSILYEKTSKFSSKESHIRVFDNKMTQLFRAFYIVLPYLKHITVQDSGYVLTDLEESICYEPAKR
jgi:hypothetical protein